jgi:GDP-6-deoxy-D-talose 4-dehydrogenase
LRVLVTGAGGFTGVHLLHALRQAGITACDLGDINLLDGPALRGRVSDLNPDAVVHLAAVAFVAHEDVDELYRTNIVGTRNLLAALASGPKRPLKVIVSSSASVYGNARAEFIDENAPTQPTNDYAVSKCAMELVAALWRNALPIVVARPFNYTGHGQSNRFVIPKLIDHFARRTSSIELGNIDVWREYNDVAGVADVYTRLISRGVAGETYNVCSGRLLSLAEIFSMLVELTGHEMKIEINPAFVRTGEVIRLGGDPAKLTRAIGELRWSSMRNLLASMLSRRESELAAT